MTKQMAQGDRSLVKKCFANSILSRLYPKVTHTQLADFVPPQSITPEKPQQSIITLTGQVCAITLYDGQ